MNKETSIRQWQEHFRNGDFNTPDRATQIKAGWYDWFCDDSALLKKTLTLSKPIMNLKDSAKVNLDTMYIWFKNNCPVAYPLYDDFRIADIATGDTLYTIAYKEPYDKEKHMWNVHAVCEGLVEPDGDFKLWKNYKFKTTKELVEWLNQK